MAINWLLEHGVIGWHADARTPRLFAEFLQSFAPEGERKTFEELFPALAKLQPPPSVSSILAAGREERRRARESS